MVTLSFYGVGIPAGVYLLLKTDFKVTGYWMGFVAAAIFLLIMQVVFIYRIDWVKNAQKAFDRSLKPTISLKLTGHKPESLELNQTILLKKTAQKILLQKLAILIVLFVIFFCLIFTRNLVKVKEDIIKTSFLLNETLSSKTKIL